MSRRSRTSAGPKTSIVPDIYALDHSEKLVPTED